MAPSTPPNCHRRTLLLVLLLAFLSADACVKRADDQPLSRVPTLPPELVLHLTSSDDSTLAAYGRRVGIESIGEAARDIQTVLGAFSPDDFERYGAPLVAALRRVWWVIASQFDYPGARWESDYIAGFPCDAQGEVFRLRAEWGSITNDSELDPDSKIEQVHRLLGVAERRGDHYLIGHCNMTLSDLMGSIGEEQQAGRYLRIALKEFSEIGYHRMTCQALAVMGHGFEQAGDIDSMIVCYEKARRLADQSRLPIQAARILTFYAGHYYRQGRLALAHQMYQDAIEKCRLYKGGVGELRFIVHAMGFYWRLDCRDIIEQLLDRVHVLRTTYSDRHPEDELQILRANRFEARLDMKRGRVDEADAIYKRLRKPIAEMRYRGEYTETLYDWAEGLLENGRIEQAAGVIKDGRRRSEKEHLPDWSARFALLEAEIEHQRGNHAKAEEALRGFESLASGDEPSLRREWIRKDALLGRLLLETGERDAAYAALNNGLNRLVDDLLGMDPSAHSYLWVNECDELRRLMQDLTAGDALLGYGAEFFWRDLYGLLGTRGERYEDSMLTTPSPASQQSMRSESGTALVERIKATGKHVSERVAAAGAVHCVYRIQNEEVWRWTVSRAGMRREVLETSEGELSTLVSDTYRMLSEDEAGADGPPPPQLAANLKTLARGLLPSEVFDESAGSLFLVTAGGFLGRIPFEAVDIGETDKYTPLLLTKDVAYMRSADPATAGLHTSPGVIIVNPRPSKELRKRYLFQQRLEQAEREGQAVAEIDPDATYLRPDSATKTCVRQVWEDAGYLYFATHVLRDPTVPYLSLIPMAVEEGNAGPDAAYLDMADVRGADLRRVDVAVLSGCSTGAPYVAAGTFGPGFGDAFLDAGAGAVVQTFWDVRDDAARYLMTSFVWLWRHEGLSCVEALNEARRRAYSGSKPDDQPFAWASYAIKISRL